jgi:hypothetical protein
MLIYKHIISDICEDSEMIKMSFTFETVAEAAAFLEGLDGTTRRPAETSPQPVPCAVPGLGMPAALNTAEPSEPSKNAALAKRTRRTKAEMQAAAKMAHDPIADAPAPAPTMPAPTIDAVRDALGQVMATRGIEAATDILTRHGVNRVGLLLPSAYASVLQDCRGE